MVSKELQILIESIKVVLLEGSKEHIESLAYDASIDWDKVDKMLKYHRIRPVFYEAMRRINIQNKVVDSAGRFSKIQAIKNLNEIQESKRVLLLLKAANIPVVPYKGILFLEKLYKNNALREIGDLDILVKPEDAVAAMRVLVADGYELAIEIEITDNVLHEIIDTFPSPEIGLDKTSSMGMNVHIDFHWGINEYEEYNIDSKNIFNNTEIGLYQCENLLIPDKFSMFKMLLNHHGGRECWVRLKDFADLIAFKKSYNEINEDVLMSLAEELKMKKIYSAANSLLQIFFISSNSSMRSFSDYDSLKRIVYLWEYSIHWDKMWPKIMVFRIYRKLQDQNLSWYSLIKSQVYFFSKVNFSEKSRPFVLPERFIVLNATSKLIGYLLRHYIQPIFKKK